MLVTRALQAAVAALGVDPDTLGAPVSTPTLATTLLGYFALVYSARASAAGKPAARWVHTAFYWHNLFLSAASLVLLVAMLENVWAVGRASGSFFFVLCDRAAYTPPLRMLYVLNYATKFYELLDTAFLVAKRKPLQFLHWYHHSLTLVLCHVQLAGQCTIQWVPITLNLMVHTVMYLYYAQTAAGVRWRRKQWITVMQIAQFVLDLVAVYYATWARWASVHVPDAWGLPYHGATCAGTDRAAYVGCAVLTSYLLLFVRFFRRTYS